MWKGIDVSKYQGNINWEQVKSQIDFAILRIGLGKFEFQKDSCFETNYNKCTSLGIPVGVYHYSYALNVEDAEKEAECVIKWLNNRKLDLPVYLDVEDNTMRGLSKSNLTKIIKAFCTKIEQAGYWAGVYANKYWLENILDYKYLEELYTIWVAQYNLQNTYIGKYDMWQKSSSGQISGINGNVDCNIMFRDLIADIKNSKVNNHQNNTTSNESKLYYFIQKGDTLSGIAQKYNTTVDFLVKLNNIKNPNLIFAGEKIRIK